MSTHKLFQYGLVVIQALIGMTALAQEQKVAQTAMEEARSLRALMQSDPHRPIYHFVAPEGRSMPFDPNGAIYWKGRYHLGYIYQTHRTGKLQHVWGHAVSTDLVHWTLYPDMLDVKPGDIEKGIFSGGAFLSREGVPHIMYHGEGSAANLVAYSKDDDLRNWTKFEGNPVLKTTVSDDPRNPNGQKYTAWDPEGWYDREADMYYQISGGNVPALFKSKDMYKWDYLGDLIAADKRATEMSEDLSCPDMFSIGNKKMLLFISHNIGTQYYLGDFKNDRFQITGHGRMNWPGGTFFAPEQLQDDKGRNIIWGWVLERKPEHLKDYGWSGIMSLPRELSLSSAGTVNIQPAKELETIRLQSVKAGAIKLAANSETVLPVRGTSMEMRAVFAAGASKPFGLQVFASDDGREKTMIKYDPDSSQLVIDFAQSSVKGPVKMESYCILRPTLQGYPEKVSQQRAPLQLKKGEPLELRVFIDKSIIEVFANGRQCVTQVVYPELPESNKIKAFTEGGPVELKSFEAWQMAPTNAY